MPAPKTSRLALALLAGVAALGVTAATGTASAAPIAPGSQLSISGPDTFTPTSISFTGPANLLGLGGDFDTVLDTCLGCVTMTSFTSGTATPFTLFTVNETGPARAASLQVLSESFVYTAGALPRLDILGSGILTLTGYDPTPGQFVLTTQGPNGAAVTFSVTAIAVPEPASLALLGAGLLGLGMVRRRKSGAEV